MTLGNTECSQTLAKQTNAKLNMDINICLDVHFANFAKERRKALNGKPDRNL